MTIATSLRVPARDLGVGGFLGWWGRELAGLLPGGGFGQAHRHPPRYLVSVERDGFYLIDGSQPKPRPAAAATEPSQDLAGLLAALAQGATSTIGIRLPYTACFVRQVELPAVAEAHMARLLALDLERNSPFLPSDTRTAHLLDPAPARAGKRAVRQLVVKRSDCDPLIARINELGLQTVWLDCWDESGSAALPVNFLAPDFERPPATPGSKIGLATLGMFAIALALSATLLLINQHESALLSLRAQTAQLKTKAMAAREALAKSKAQLADVVALEQLRDGYVSKALVLDELTKLLPDQVWVTDLKIEGSAVDVSGLAESAASLVRILERSRTFGDVTMTSAVTFDQRESRERFSLQMRLRSPGAVPAPAAEGRQ